MRDVPVSIATLSELMPRLVFPIETSCREMSQYPASLTLFHDTSVSRVKQEIARNGVSFRIHGSRRERY